MTIKAKRLKLRLTEPTEGELHASVADYLDWFLMPPAFYTTFPAGWGIMAKSTAGRLKGAGLKPGMPDILVFYERETFGIELKSFGRKATAIQKVTHMRLLDAGVKVAVCDSLDMVISALRVWGLPLRRTKGATDAA